MRIIAGEFKSRLLTFPKNKLTRPMMDRVREMVFNILGDFVKDASILDVFAGCGSIGLEALSRGADEVTFVENGPWALKTLHQNLERLELKDRAVVLTIDVEKALKRLQHQHKNFSIIFLDPPYNQGLVKKILLHLDQSDIVTPLTQIILHHSRQEKLPESLEKLQVLREKRIGQACLSFLSGGKN